MHSLYYTIVRLCIPTCMLANAQISSSR